MRKCSTVRASANELGGMMQSRPFTSTNERSSNSFGSTTRLWTLVKTLNSGATRMSYPNEESPYETLPFLTWPDSKGSIMPCSRAISRIQRSLLTGMGRGGVGGSGDPRREWGTRGEGGVGGR